MVKNTAALSSALFINGATVELAKAAGALLQDGQINRRRTDKQLRKGLPAKALSLAEVTKLAAGQGLRLVELSESKDVVWATFVITATSDVIVAKAPVAVQQPKTKKVQRTQHLGALGLPAHARRD